MTVSLVPFSSPGSPDPARAHTSSAQLGPAALGALLCAAPPAAPYADRPAGGPSEALQPPAPTALP